MATSIMRGKRFDSLIVSSDNGTFTFDFGTPVIINQDFTVNLAFADLMTFSLI